MSACPACGERVGATAKYCRMCGHPLVATPSSAGAGIGDCDELNSPSDGGDDDEEMTLSYVADVLLPVSAAATKACEICGQAADEGAARCAACTRLLAPSGRDEG